jgi:hypothetical protein
MGALVGAHATGAVVLDANPAEEAMTGERPSIGAGVVLGVGPYGGLAIADERTLELPVVEQLGAER